MTQLMSKPLNWFRRDEKQPRKTFGEAELRSLGESMKGHGQLQPVGAKPDGTLLWGERRWRAAQLIGLKDLQVIITDKPLTEAEIRVIQLTENMNRVDLTGFEKWAACSELMCMNPQWGMKDLAEAVRLDPSMVTRLLSPSKCIPAWQEALKEGKAGLSDCYAASKLPESEQAGLLALKLGGASRDQIEQAGRKSRNGRTAAVKVSRIKCPLPSGAVVQVSGDGISLDDMIEAMVELLKEARKASEQGLDAKTFQAVMKDKAKAGG
jgi:ParB/RepB/Spo0J family partition protein